LLRRHVDKPGFAVEIGDNIAPGFGVDLVLVQAFVKIVELDWIERIGFEPVVFVNQPANKLVIAVEVDMVLVAAANLVTLVLRQRAELGAIVPTTHRG